MCFALLIAEFRHERPSAHGAERIHSSMCNVLLPHMRADVSVPVLAHFISVRRTPS